MTGRTGLLYLLLLLLLGLMWLRLRSGHRTASAHHLGEQLLDRGDYEAALMEFQSATQQQPQVASHWVGMAKAQIGLSRYDNALRALHHALQLDAQVQQAHLLLGYLYEKKGVLNAAEQHYRQAVTQDGQEVVSLNGLAYFLAQHTKSDAALEEATALAQKANFLLGGRNPYILDTLGWTYFRRHQLDRARPLLSAAYRRLPKHPEIAAHYRALQRALKRRAR